eukprot:NODE_1076_length_1433_cov_0.376312.p1 type:complete len:147 gc:universal NODE_1076_length_1433_cov_0.376312:928-1368(+)
MLDTRHSSNMNSLNAGQMVLPSFRKLNEILFSNREDFVDAMHVKLKPKPQMSCRSNSSRYTNLNYYTKLPSAPERIGRARRRPDEMKRFYGCRQNGCAKAYESISHLNTHIRRKNHGKPLTKADFPEIYDQNTNTSSEEYKLNKSE